MIQSTFCFEKAETIINYAEFPVPPQLSNFVRRILCAQFSEATSITIPARPTGYNYVGWLAEGGAVATANGTRFVSAQSMVHFSGQLTTFDAEYTLSGPGIHFLAELHAYSGFAILDRDIGALRNQVIALGEYPDMPSTLDGFVEVLTATFPPVPATVMPEILTAVQQIEAADGAISISQLADELGMNDRVFRRQFSRIVGMSPKSFAVCQRIIAALKLMAMNPDKSIVDVGYEAGFADQSHLTNTFKQYMRTTPAKLELDTDGVLRSIVAQI